MDPACSFLGLEISPQVFELANSRTIEQLHFKKADIQQEHDALFDLLLEIDAIEYIENCYGFLRCIQPKRKYKMISSSAQTVCAIAPKQRSSRCVRTYNFHFSSKDLALEMLKDVGKDLLGYFYAPSAENLVKNTGIKVFKVSRVVLFFIHKDLAVRVLGVVVCSYEPNKISVDERLLKSLKAIGQ